MEFLSIYEIYDNDVLDMFENLLRKEKKYLDLNKFKKIFYNLGRN